MCYKSACCTDAISPFRSNDFVGRSAVSAESSEFEANVGIGCEMNASAYGPQSDIILGYSDRGFLLITYQTRHQYALLSVTAS